MDKGRDLSIIPAGEDSKLELEELRKILAKLSAELVTYQVKETTSSKKIPFPSKQTRSATSAFLGSKFLAKLPPWLSNVQYLSPLVSAYEVCKPPLPLKFSKFRTFLADFFCAESSIHTLEKSSIAIWIAEWDLIKKVSDRYSEKHILRGTV